MSCNLVCCTDKRDRFYDHVNISTLKDILYVRQMLVNKIRYEQVT